MIRKIITTIILIILVIGAIPLKSNAVVPIDSAYIYATKKTERILMWNGLQIRTHMAVYNKDGVEYPAYCLNRDLPGVEIGFSQTVDVENFISDVMVWRAIINGYPYKTIEELGCKTEEEAYLATKQAVYSMLTNRDISEYSAIGESGERCLNALKQIAAAARSSNEVKLSSELKINQINSLWQIDNIDNKYVSQEFSVSANAGFSTYKIELSNVNIEGIKVTDLNNNEKTEFNYNEKFKILIPVKNITLDGDLSINAYGKVATKPVLYGKSRDAGLQNYAITGYTYEDGTGSKKVYYTKNDTKIIIVKKDEKDQKYLQGVEFNLLDENKNIIHAALTTDENGKIEINNLLPGTYYIQETRTLEGYNIYDKLIKVELELNETSTINVINTEEEPNIEVNKTYTENTVKNINTNTVVKLPKTGM